MKRLISMLALVAATVGFVFVQPVPAHVDVNVSIGIPGLVVASPPVVVLVPQTRVYFAPDVSSDLFFFQGVWWLRDSDHWYRSHEYRGPWRVVTRRSVPAAVVRIPRDHRKRYARERRIPYGQFEKAHTSRKTEPSRGSSGSTGRGGGKEKGKGKGHGKGH